MLSEVVISAILLTMIFTAKGREPALGCQLIEDCGLSKYDWFDRRRVLNSIPARPKMFPWIVGVGPTSCTGSIVTKRYILTARHCDYKNEKWFRLSIQFGSDSDLIGTRVKPVDFRVHKRWDLIITKLPYDLTFNDYVQPLCFPPKMDYEKFRDANIISVGFGETNSEMRNELHWGMPSVNAQRSTDWFTVKGYPSFANRGDSGSPLIMRYNGRMYQIGVYIGRNNDLRVNYHEDVWRLRNWIFDSIAEMDGKPNHCQNQTDQ